MPVPNGWYIPVGAVGIHFDSRVDTVRVGVTTKEIAIRSAVEDRPIDAGALAAIPPVIATALVIVFIIAIPILYLIYGPVNAVVVLSTNAISA